MEGTVWQNVLYRLQADDLIRIARVSRDLYRRARANAYWRRHMERVVTAVPQLASLFESWITSATNELTVHVERDARGRFKTPTGIWRRFAKALFAFYRFRGVGYNDCARALQSWEKRSVLMVAVALDFSAAFQHRNHQPSTALGPANFYLDDLCTEMHEWNRSYFCDTCQEQHESTLIIQIDSRKKANQPRRLCVFLRGCLIDDPIAREFRQFNSLVVGGSIPEACLADNSEPKKQKTT
jgi:hypothetical protein